MYHAHILSHIKYLNLIWNVAAQTKMNELSRLQNRVLKIIKCLPYFTPSFSLYSATILPIRLINKFETTLFVYKIVNNLVKQNVELRRVGETHSYRTRRVDVLHVNRFRTTSCGNDILCAGLIFFNELPATLKWMTSISRFKHTLAGHRFEGSA